jgi:Domain of unknown function (DUF4136)
MCRFANREKAMKRTVCLGIALTLAFLFADPTTIAQKVKTDYVQGYNFGALKRFAWRKNHLFTMRRPEDNELLDRKIMRAVNQQLIAKGFTEDAAKPDFYVFYHAGPGDEGIQTGASPPPTWDSIRPPALNAATSSHAGTAGGGTNAGFAPSVWYSVQGQFVFYAEDAKSKVVVWESNAIKKWHDVPKARKNEDKEIEQIVGKSFKNFPPKNAK